MSDQWHNYAKVAEAPAYVTGPDGYVCENIEEVFDTVKYLLQR